MLKGFLITARQNGIFSSKWTCFNFPTEPTHQEIGIKASAFTYVKSKFLHFGPELRGMALPIWSLRGCDSAMWCKIKDLVLIITCCQSRNSRELNDLTQQARLPITGILHSFLPVIDFLPPPPPITALAHSDERRHIAEPISDVLRRDPCTIKNP